MLYSIFSRIFHVIDLGILAALQINMNILILDCYIVSDRIQLQPYVVVTRHLFQLELRLLRRYSAQNSRELDLT